MLNRFVFTALLILSAQVLFLTSAIAQNLPNLQTVSLRAPKTMKVDGRSNDWNDRYLAYNHSVDFYYTMANDNDNLYLIIKATDPNIITRVINGGVCLTLQNQRSKTSKNISVTYPVMEHATYFSLKRKTRDEADTTRKTADSIMNHNNQLFAKNSKWIKLLGVEGIDTLISIYNLDGIKAAGQFNNQHDFVCELSVPLKYLKPFLGDGMKFNYHMIVNGTKPMGKVVAISTGDGDPQKAAVIEEVTARINSNLDRMASPTDFWGEYTLVKIL